MGIARAQVTMPATGETRIATAMDSAKTIGPRTSWRWMNRRRRGVTEAASKSGRRSAISQTSHRASPVNTWQPA